MPLDEAMSDVAFRTATPIGGLSWLSSVCLIDLAVVLHCRRAFFSSFLKAPCCVTKIQNVVGHPGLLLPPGFAKYLRCSVDECSMDALLEIVYVFFQQVMCCKFACKSRFNRSAILRSLSALQGRTRVLSRDSANFPSVSASPSS